ncbi:general substrate transporter [Xylogone sp. PMI_703]|nr:general substrate transporter [Xylogone sp. PMI_703]
MLKRAQTGTWLPAYVPDSSVAVVTLLMVCSMTVSTAYGVSRSMLNGLNILPKYTSYFKLNETTLGITTSAVFIGGCLAPGCAGLLCDRMGRRPAIFWGSVVAMVGILLQSTAQNIAMFIVARVLVGFGIALTNIATGTYLSETFPSAWRSWGVSMLNNFYYIGALIIAVVTLATSSWDSAWAWRTPCITQAVFTILCTSLLPFIPESPRWLIHQGHYDAARFSVALVASNGDTADTVSNALYEKIEEGSKLENSQKLDVSFRGIINDPVARRRLLIGASAGSFSAVAGNIIATFYLGAELKTAGITDTVSQLKANIALNAWCFPCTLVGTQVISRWGRKSTAAVTEALLIVCLLIIGILSKVYADDPSNATTGLIYANVAIMFLFQGIYSVAWTPLCTLYPPEIANFAIRAHTVGLSQFCLNTFATIFVIIMPIAFKNIGWRVYIINASWDVVIVALIACFWVETKGKTLEEINTIFDTRARESLSNIEGVNEGVVISAEKRAEV